MKLSTLAALCTALECTPNDLIDVDITPVQQAPAKELRIELAKMVPGRSMPPL